MKQTNAANLNGAERRSLFARLVREVLASMKPNCGRFSGQQIAYAKGRAWKQMKALGC